MGLHVSDKDNNNNEPSVWESVRAERYLVIVSFKYENADWSHNVDPNQE